MNKEDELRETEQRLATLRLAIRDWAEGHGYLDRPPQKRPNVAGFHNVDANLLDAYYQADSLHDEVEA